MFGHNQHKRKLPEGNTANKKRRMSARDDVLRRLSLNQYSNGLEQDEDDDDDQLNRTAFYSSSSSLAIPILSESASLDASSVFNGDADGTQLSQTVPDPDILSCDWKSEEPLFSAPVLTVVSDPTVYSEIKTKVATVDSSSSSLSMPFMTSSSIEHGPILLASVSVKAAPRARGICDEAKLDTQDLAGVGLVMSYPDICNHVGYPKSSRSRLLLDLQIKAQKVKFKGKVYEENALTAENTDKVLEALERLGIKNRYISRDKVRSLREGLFARCIQNKIIWSDKVINRNSPDTSPSTFFTPPQFTHSHSLVADRLDAGRSPESQIIAPPSIIEKHSISGIRLANLIGTGWVMCARDICIHFGFTSISTILRDSKIDRTLFSFGGRGRQKNAFNAEQVDQFLKELSNKGASAKKIGLFRSATLTKDMNNKIIWRDEVTSKQLKKIPTKSSTVSSASVAQPRPMPSSLVQTSQALQNIRGAGYWENRNESSDSGSSSSAFLKLTPS